MRLCVSCIYWTLLLVSVVSSGLLFLIVASEGTRISDKPRGIDQEDKIPVENVVEDTGQGIPTTSSISQTSEIRVRPTVKTGREQLYSEESDGIQPSQESFPKAKVTKNEKNVDVLRESLTQQPNLSQGISETGQAVVLTLVDTVDAELQSLAEPRLTGEISSRSSGKNTTFLPSTTVTTSATTTTTTRNVEQDQVTLQPEESSESTLSSILIPTESSTNFTEVEIIDEEETINEIASHENLEEEEEEEVNEEGQQQQEQEEIIVVRAEQKFVNEPTVTRKPEEFRVEEEEIREEPVKQEENLTPAPELDDSAARARLVSGSAEEASAAILDGLVASGSTDHHHHEDIPSFSEWAQKRLEEAEKKKTHPNASIQNPGGPGRGVGGMKMRSKNYASPDCGAKIVAVNPEARSARSVLVSTRDEYMLNTCTSRVWFVVELCEAIQAKKIELANFELFSSSPKDFSVHVSDRFPTRDWSPVGQFTAKDQRDIQSFTLHPHLFGKFIKVEMHSHYGSEHFCPISLFRAYGTSEFEVLETETDHQESDEDDDDDDDDEALDSDAGGESSRNLFGSARDAVLRIVKKAAEVLVKTGDLSNKNNITKIQESIEDNIMKSSLASCTTPRYTINCPNCTDHRFAGVFQLLSCRAGHLDEILTFSFINDTMRSGELCDFYGVDVVNLPRNRNKEFADNDDDERVIIDDELSKTKYFLDRNLPATFLASIFSSEYIIALCNVIATKERKLVLNTSYEVVGNISVNSSTRIDGPAGKMESFENTVHTRVVVATPCLSDSDPTGCKSSGISRETKGTRIHASIARETEAANVHTTETTATSFENLASQIKPTKTLNKEDMRKESSVPILEPSKDPNEESIQAQVLTTPSPILNIATATSRLSDETLTTESFVESTQQIATPVVTVANSPYRNGQETTIGHEHNHENTAPIKQDNFEQETKQVKAESGEQDIKMMPQDHLSLDTLLSDLKDLEGEGSGIHGSVAHNANTVAHPTASSTPQQKESVFLRLSNRIKALERNMSLSGQYLEELSKRYKKQVEEMQRSLERATAAMGEESRKGEERELRRLEEISALREEINSLTQSMEILLYDRNSWPSKLSTICQHFALIIIEIVVLLFVVSYCRRSSQLEDVDESGVTMENEITRRRSAGAMTNVSSTKKTRKRRPSEIASRINGTYRDLMIEDRFSSQESKKDKKKRRKRELSIRPATNGDFIKEDSGYDQGMPGGTVLPSRRSSSIDPPSNHAKQLELSHTRKRPDSAPEYSGGWTDPPILESSIHEETKNLAAPIENTLPQQRRSVLITDEANCPSDHSDGTKEEEKKTTTGALFRTGGILKAAKLSSPSFMKTALGARSKRNSKTGGNADQVVHLRSDNWEWYSRNSGSRSTDDASPSNWWVDGASSGHESPSESGPTNGHHLNVSDDSGSSSATTTPGTKKDKRSGGGLRKMVRKLF